MVQWVCLSLELQALQPAMAPVLLSGLLPLLRAPVQRLLPVSHLAPHPPLKVPQRPLASPLAPTLEPRICRLQPPAQPASHLALLPIKMRLPQPVQRLVSEPPQPIRIQVPRHCLGVL